METKERAAQIARLQQLAVEERQAHLDEDEAAISTALDLIEERVRARVARQRRSQILLVAAAVVGALTAILALWPRRR
ncbi:hypothetical protein [Variovorax sp. SRS16]|uniref:hypothetical protein n=1 Tax=Variovorax sp. SRS16 TaxID=282217 RepID=UPI0013A5981A|nr:hypothetical protein [Variovorax sp. SRS16]